MTETLTQRTARHEGFRAMPYLDTRGNWTVAYGHKITLAQAKQDYAGGVTLAQGMMMLTADLDTATRLANGALAWLNLIDQLRQEVVVEMVFQLGIQGTLAFKHMLNAIQGDDWDAAAQAMLDSEWHQQTPARCEELAGLMIKGSDSC